MSKRQRIRDPLHDLIEFDTSDFDQIMWSIVGSKEFQRLRRVKQLGFTELVYPGACHTRFAHSIGVFHTARMLSKIIKDKTSNFDDNRSKVAIAASLVHDLGHGPFSHAFEEAMRYIDKSDKAIKHKRHELWTSDIITGDTQINENLSRISPQFRDDVSELLSTEIPRDVYHSIVSSQLDADRLDYIRRDRLMTGAQHGGFDFSWLIANLEVQKIPLSTDGEVFGEVDSLIIGNKALQAAESFVLGLFHMYFTVYFHKATRSAEKMLGGLLGRVGILVRDGLGEKTGLGIRHPLIVFLGKRSLDSYLKLDDFVIWGALAILSDSEDHICSELSSRLLSRDLYKAIDVGAKFDGREDKLMLFKTRLRSEVKENKFTECDIFEDEAPRNPYKRKSGDSPEALSKILIQRADGNGYEDLAGRSVVVGNLKEKKEYRIYARNAEVRGKIETLLGDVRNG